MKLAIPYLGSLAALIALDLLWILVIMAEFYRGSIGHLMGAPNFLAASVFYLLYVGGVFIFAVLPAYRAGRMRRALMLGALLGLVAYGTYDLTNMATLRDWPLMMTVVDMLWGALLTSVIALIGFTLTRAYNRERGG